MFSVFLNKLSEKLSGLKAKMGKMITKKPKSQTSSAYQAVSRSPTASPTIDPQAPCFLQGSPSRIIYPQAPDHGFDFGFEPEDIAPPVPLHQGCSIRQVTDDEISILTTSRQPLSPILEAAKESSSPAARKSSPPAYVAPQTVVRRVLGQVR